MELTRIQFDLLENLAISGESIFNVIFWEKSLIEHLMSWLKKGL